MKAARLRPLAKTDLGDQAAYYAEVAGANRGDDFVDTALAALKLLEEQPSIGSPRWNPPGQVPPLRAWRLGRYPFLWFYFEGEDHIDVVRLLGEREDIAAILAHGPD